MATSRNQHTAAAASALEVLEAFAQHVGALRLNALAEITRKPKATVHRILSTLINAGYVARDEGSRQYRLTLKTWRIGVSALAGLDLVKEAGPVLERLMRATDETVHLAVLDPGGDVIYISKVEAPRSIRVQTGLGRLNPAWCTATGRSLLAFNPEVAERVLARPREARTPYTVTDTDTLRTILAATRAKAYAVTKAEHHIEMGGIASCIFDHANRAVAACGVAVPVFRMNRKLIERCIPQVLAAAREISAALGFRPVGHAGTAAKDPARPE